MPSTTATACAARGDCDPPRAQHSLDRGRCSGRRPESAPFNEIYGAAHAFDLPFAFGNFGPSLLVQLRETRGLSQAGLADRLGLTQSEVSKFERGERALDVLQLRTWLRALGVAFASFTDALDRELEELDANLG